MAREVSTPSPRGATFDRRLTLDGVRWRRLLGRAAAAGRHRRRRRRGQRRPAAAAPTSTGGRTKGRRPVHVVTIRDDTTTRRHATPTGVLAAGVATDSDGGPKS